MLYVVNRGLKENIILKKTSIRIFKAIKKLKTIDKVFLTVKFFTVTVILSVSLFLDIDRGCHIFKTIFCDIMYKFICE